MKHRKITFVYEADAQMEKWKQTKTRNTLKLYLKVSKYILEIENNLNVSSEIFKKIVGLQKAWEIRINFNKESHRFYGSYANGTIVVMRYYLSKKTGKTPKRIIDKLRRDEKTNITE